MLESGEKADVSICVKDHKIKVHSFVLEINAPTLWEFCREQKSSSRKGGTPLVIDDVSPDALQMALFYVYGKKLGDDTMVKFGEELITTADKYELIELKATVENALIRNCVINKANVSHFILLADAKNCPKLKEHAVSYFILHAKEVLKSEHSRVS